MLLPFAAGFYLSYLFRNINALIGSYLSYDLDLGVADLGLVTAAYFLAFALAQIPIGIALDRYGPRRVQSVLLMIAAAGAALFAAGQGVVVLTLGRALIGLGVAASLTAGLKAIILWYPKERVALVNGYMVMLGALGAVTATVPAKLVLTVVDWRVLFEWLAVATAFASALVYLAVPEAPSQPSAVSVPAGLTTIYSERRFWRLAPLAAVSVGSAWALQGLWAAPWLTDVAGVSRSALSWYLLAMAVALSAGGALLGRAANRLARHGVEPQELLAAITVIAVTAQLVLALDLPLPSLLPWCVIAAVGAATVLSYAAVAELFPKELAGRANAALNVFHLGGAFVLQYATGFILAQWPTVDAHRPAVAYQVAFALNVGVQLAALAWFRWAPAWFSSSVPALRFSRLPADAAVGQGCTSHQHAADVWAMHLLLARAQVRNWRVAALGTLALSALLMAALLGSVWQSSHVAHVIEIAKHRH